MTHPRTVAIAFVVVVYLVTRGPGIFAGLTHTRAELAENHSCLTIDSAQVPSRSLTNREIRDLERDYAFVMKQITGTVDICLQKACVGADEDALIYEVGHYLRNRHLQLTNAYRQGGDDGLEYAKSFRRNGQDFELITNIRDLVSSHKLNPDRLQLDQANYLRLLLAHPQDGEPTCAPEPRR